MDLSKFVVREGGSVNKAATVAAFEKLLGEYITAQAERDGKVADAVSAVFDEYRGAHINMPALCSLACTKLGADKDTFATLTEAVQGYVQANSQGKKDKDTGAVENPSSLFVIERGRGGGVSRRADTTPAA